MPAVASEHLVAITIVTSVVTLIFGIVRAVVWLKLANTAQMMARESTTEGKEVRLEFSFIKVSVTVTVPKSRNEEASEERRLSEPPV